MTQPVGQGLLKVPFARCSDGIARHVSAVSDIRQGPFRCLDCNEALTLRQPIKKRRHFAHRPDSKCTGETALHRYAKELLAAARTLTLPALVLEKERIHQPVFAAGTYEFDAVLTEHKIGTFQPDALVRYLGFELAVEFRVSHAVDSEKRAKVREYDISMIEIDLSGLKIGQMEGESLDKAILHTASRSWIHHRKSAAAKRKLEAAVAREKTERGARLRAHILRKRYVQPPADWTDEAMLAVSRSGLETLIGIEADGGHWFAVNNKVWQAQALFEHVIKPSEQYSPGGKNLEIRGDFPSYHDLSSKIPNWMFRTDLAQYPDKRLGEAGFSKESYGSPHAAVWCYFAKLSVRGQAVFWSGEDQCFYIEPELQNLLYRRFEMDWRVRKLLRAAEADDANAYERWKNTYRSDNLTPCQLIEAGGDGYRDLLSRITRLETMVSGYIPKVVDDLCGLPLERIRHRRQEQILAAEAEKAAALEKAAAGRQSSIRQQAIRLLESEAPAWLARKVPGSEITHLEYACEDDEALTRLECQLYRDSDARRKRIAAERYAQELRGRPTDAAKQAFPRTEMAELFLNSAHPKLQGGRPIERCQTQQDLVFILTLMPKKR